VARQLTPRDDPPPLQGDRLVDQEDPSAESIAQVPEPLLERTRRREVASLVIPCSISPSVNTLTKSAPLVGGAARLWRLAAV